MNRIDALKELLAKVKAGEWDFRADAPARQIFPYNSSSADDLGLTARAAFDGSLDAAKALHEAVLPNYGWVIAEHNRARLWILNPPLPLPWCEADNPARAWLIAILKALIAEANGREGGE